MDVRNKHCEHEGCPKAPCFNLPGCTPGVLCRTHRLEGMVDVKHKRYGPAPLRRCRSRCVCVSLASFPLCTCSPCYTPCYLIPSSFGPARLSVLSRLPHAQASPPYQFHGCDGLSGWQAPGISRAAVQLRRRKLS